MYVYLFQIKLMTR